MAAPKQEAESEVQLDLHPGPLLLTDVDTAVERFTCWRAKRQGKRGRPPSEIRLQRCNNTSQRMGLARRMQL